MQSSITHVLAGDGVNNIIRRGTKQLSDDRELVDVILSGKQRFALKHLSKDATGTPDINLDIVFLPGEHNFGGSVVPCGDITSHLRILDSCKTKVANLEITVFVYENIAGFEIAVDDAGRMHVLETSLQGN
jgi:hypothetical protein